LTGAEEIVIGTPVAGRRHEELSGIVGMFVNTLALKNNPAGEKKLGRFIKEVGQRSSQAVENQEYPFEDLVTKLSISGESARNPLFDVMFTMQNMDIPSLEIPGLKLEPFELETGVSKFDITIIAEEIEKKLTIKIEYSSELFKEETITRIINYFKTLAAAVIAGREKTLSEIAILPEEEKKKLLFDFNKAANGNPVAKTIHELFEEQVGKTPENTAVIGRAHAAYAGAHETGKKVQDTAEIADGTADTVLCTLTYRELNEITDKLARCIRKQGEAGSRMVGIHVDRSVEMIIGLLGILKAGSAYVPLNPKAPAERNRYILDECRSELLLTLRRQEEGSEKIAAGRKVIYLDEKDQFIALAGDEKEQTKPAQPTNHLSTGHAYVIFTSGSTGKPKGVPITHANLSPLLHWGYNALGIDGNDRALQNLSYYFDWSVWEIFLNLTAGAGLYMISEEQQMNPEACSEFIRENEITVLHVTPTQWQYVLNVKNRYESLRHLCIGAEKLTLDLVKRSIGVVAEECRIYNMYGPTEATIISAILQIDKNAVEKYKNLSSVPIGEPVGNTNLLVLDKNMEPVPLKVEGELYIGGDGVAHGYLNNPELTAEKFIKTGRQLAVGDRQKEIPNNQYP
ncbi:MAG: amino acid adenylation domain-containing protein, partial [bacterium]|nr:amino acid adenylation domain-containing protein [bacterium]